MNLYSKTEPNEADLAIEMTLGLCIEEATKSEDDRSSAKRASRARLSNAKSGIPLKKYLQRDPK